MKIIVIRILFFSFSISNASNLFAQNKTTDKSINEIFSKNHIAFTAKGLLFQKGKIMGESMPFNPGANSRLGFEAGIDYLINKSKKISLNTGFYIGFAPRNFTFLVPKSYVFPSYNDDYMINGGVSNIFPLIYVNIPLSIEKRVFKNNKFLYYSGGLNLKYALMFSDDTDNFYLDTRGTRIAVMNENWKNNINFFVQANASFGYGFIFKNKNIFKVGFSSNIALSNVSTANYKFTSPMLASQEGTYATRGGFIGLSFSYVLTNSNKRLLKNR